MRRTVWFAYAARLQVSGFQPPESPLKPGRFATTAGMAPGCDPRGCRSSPTVGGWLHEAFQSRDYEITFDEREEHDAEISFEADGISGQVKFADECREGRVYVRVTSRPAG